MRNLGLAVAAVLTLSGVAPASAQAAESASAFNLFVFGDMTAPSSDVQGRVAVGGNANLSNYSVGLLAPSRTTNNLVVGGNFTLNGGTVYGKTVVGGNANVRSMSLGQGAQGNAVNFTVGGNLDSGDGSVVGKTAVTGAYHGPQWYDPSSGGTTQHAAPVSLPVDFTAEATRLRNLSTALDGYANTGVASTLTWGGAHSTQITLNALSAGLNVFDLNGSSLADTNTFTIRLGPTSTLLINVNGLTGFFNGGINIIGGTAANVLWNFTDATTLTFGGLGSILAPKATLIGGGAIDGQVVVNKFTGTTQINWAPNSSGLLNLVPPGVPEPATWTMMIMGFGMVGAVLRRRRAAAVLA